MIIRKDVDLGAAFERLKESLLDAEAYKNKDNERVELRYAGAYGRLSAAVSAFLFINTEGESFDDICSAPVFNAMPPIDQEIEDELIN